MDTTNTDPKEVTSPRVGEVAVSLAKRRDLQIIADRLMLQYFLARDEWYDIARDVRDARDARDSEELNCFFLYARQLVKLLKNVGLTQYDHTAIKEQAEAILLRQSRARAVGMLEAQELKQEREERRAECRKKEADYKQFRAEKARARQEAYKLRAAKDKLEKQESRRKRREASSKIKSP